MYALLTECFVLQKTTESRNKNRRGRVLPSLPSEVLTLKSYIFTITIPLNKIPLKYEKIDPNQFSNARNEKGHLYICSLWPAKRLDRMS